MSDGTWYESPITCITLYYRQCYTEMYVRWNLVRKPYNTYYLVLQAMLHDDVCQMELGSEALEHVLPWISGNMNTIECNNKWCVLTITAQMKSM